jgi:hypothetical protein
MFPPHASGASRSLEEIMLQDDRKGKHSWRKVGRIKRDGQTVCDFVIHNPSPFSLFSLLRQILNSDKQLVIRERVFTSVDILQTDKNNQ